MDPKEIWQTVLGEIELQISRPNFLTWLKQSELLSRDEKEGTAFVGLPNNFAKEWVKNRYHKIILGSLRNIDGSIKNISYVVVNNQNPKIACRRHRVPRSSLNSLGRGLPGPAAPALCG